MSNTIKFPESRLGYEIAINEMKNLIDEQAKSVDRTKSTAQNVLGAASLIIALVGALPNIVPGNTDKPSILYWFFIIISAVLYCILIGLCVYILGMRHYAGPVKADWNTLYQAYVRHTDDLSVLKTQLSSYLNILKVNRNMVWQKAKFANWAAVLLLVIVILLIIASLVK